MKNNLHVEEATDKNSLDVQEEWFRNSKAMNEEGGPEMGKEWRNRSQSNDLIGENIRFLRVAQNTSLVLLKPPQKVFLLELEEQVPVSRKEKKPEDGHNCAEFYRV